VVVGRAGAEPPLECCRLRRVLREVEHVLACAQLLFRALALGDIGQRAGEQRLLSARVGKEFSARADPAQLAGRVDDAIFDLESTGPAREARLDRLVNALLVLRMDPTLRLQRGTARDLHAVGSAEQLTPARRHERPIGHRIPFPEPVVRSFHYSRIALLGFAQRGLGLLAPGDVAPYAVVALEPAVLVKNRCPADAEITDRSVRCDTRTLEVAERLTGRKYGLVLGPGAGQRGQGDKLPTGLADRGLRRISGQAIDLGRQVREAQVLVLLPVPVG
jgi:hypothetical protein